MRRLEQAIAPREPINFRFKPAGLAGITFKVWCQASIPCRAALVPLTPALSELNINVNSVLVCRNTSTLLHIHLLAPPSRTGQTRQEFQMISMTPAFVAKECWLRRVESQRHQAGFQEAQRARSTSYIFVRFVSRRRVCRPWPLSYNISNACILRRVSAGPAFLRAFIVHADALPTVAAFEK